MFTRSDYKASVQEIAETSSKLHTQIINAMNQLETVQGVGVAAATREWRLLHSMLKATGIVGDLAYDEITTHTSAFPEPIKYEPPF